MKKNSTIVYLSMPDENGEGQRILGTSLYKKEEDEFICCKTIEYKANSAVMLLRVENSWHGGHWEVSLPYPRRTLQFFIRKS